MPNIIECSQAYFRCIECDVSLFDDNGNTVYSKGERTFTYEEVSIIRRVLEHDTKDKFMLTLQGVGYICLRSTDKILYGKGYFNDGADYHAGARNKSSTVEGTKKEATSKVGKMNSFRGQHHTCTRRESSTTRAMGEEMTSKGREIDSFVNDAKVVGYINSGYTIECDTSNNNVLNELNANSSNNGAVNKKNVHYQTHLTYQRLNLLQTARSSLKQSKKSRHGVSFAAVLVQNYLIMMHGSSNGHVSWMHVLSNFRDKMKEH